MIAEPLERGLAEDIENIYKLQCSFLQCRYLQRKKSHLAAPPLTEPPPPPSFGSNFVGSEEQQRHANMCLIFHLNIQILQLCIK